MGNQPKEVERETPTLSQIRFGELEVGDKFVFDGCWLVKTGEYQAESDKKRGKNHCLFFKKDMVQHEYLGDISHDEIDSHLQLHENGSEQSTKFVTPKTGRFDDKYDLFDDHLDTIERCQNSEKPRCQIVITPSLDRRHKIEVLEGEDYQWSTLMDADLSQPWTVPLRLKSIILIMIYDGNEIQLHHNSTKIWARCFKQGWAGIHTCTITIEDIRLNSDVN